MEKFLTKIPNRNNEMILESDLILMKNYQLNLINEMMFCKKLTPGKDSFQLMTKLLKEISDVEKWLKKHYTIFINDNNRKLCL